jgi:hypothetical protein
MTEVQLDGYCQSRTRELLKIAAVRLTPAQLDLCYRTDPHAALEFAADLLTIEQISQCAQIAPAKALLFASHRMTPEQIVAASELATGKLRTVMGTQPYHPVVDALHSVRNDLSEKLRISTDRALGKRGEGNHDLQGATNDQTVAKEILALEIEQIAARAITDPLAVLLHAGHRLSPDQIVKAAGRCGPQLRAVLSNNPAQSLVMTLAAVAPRLTAPTHKAVKDAFAAAISPTA